ncbi:exopolyphosphatase/guanosine-5'-triphosphate,3'-diphosphate pyrophosphatase [Actinoplanes lutulentus]|uniref:Ppx/GppA phosphatase n=1 Tax=Actinoplanes lutulentus TaxID=1287878 RepID=A0A327ZHQ4_9ACTN|nr:Ppx/GppA phosphatase family protein [Actinoplanes lutulentus]MBB2945535.1 exopolyphosphatase/guanosine-5'-triphosphate,3'-diphosphate pyrophosphatase [Actinoplanes lutulentus]RAK40333.1 Ppx/GppA phosphatase [Actinoplanes lutulentus]
MRVAAIDCGTNAIRLLIADVAGGQLVDVARRMEIVRLGEGVDRTGLLAPAAIERTRQALLGYAAEIAELGVTRVRMCATSATRDAENSAIFRDMVRGVLGIDPEVITGEEEATLSFLGAVQGLDAPGPYLVFDLGGGSTEFVTGTATVEHAISMDIGCVRMTERHLHSDPPTPAEIAAATADITKAVDTALAAVSPAITLVGLAGTVTTVAAIASELPGYDSERIHHSRISAADVARVTDTLLAMTVAERRALPVMHPGRADVIGAGALIEKIIVERSGHDVVIASEHDILDGIAFGLAEAA